MTARGARCILKATQSASIDIEGTNTYASQNPDSDTKISLSEISSVQHGIYPAPWGICCLAKSMEVVTGLPGLNT